tara:strand:+ start:39 stop:752 length:714 start_codon:yes stop_codon:yes gene_type:complete
MSKEGLQLELFEGEVLTTEQQEIVNKEKIRLAATCKRRENECATISRMLVEAGFIEGVEFENNFQSKMVERELSLGYSFDDSQFKTTQLIPSFKGSVVLKTKRFDSETTSLVDGDASISLQDGKLECYQVTGSFRALTPHTLRKKLKLSIEGAKQTTEIESARKRSMDTIIEDIKSKYVDAKIEINRYTNEITTTFKSGSSVTFKVYSSGRTMVTKRRDVVTGNLDLDMTMAAFNAQ